MPYIDCVQALNLLGEPPWRPAALKGFSDEDAAWIDGLAQCLDVANHVGRRVAGTTDPELAVEAVRGGAGRRPRLGSAARRQLFFASTDRSPADCTKCESEPKKDPVLGHSRHLLPGR
jgi:uncharacterized protein (DUF1800 family)